MDIQQKIGKLISEYRKKKEWSQVQLSEKLGVDRSYISSLEGGKRNPSITSLDKVAGVLGIGIEQLTAGTGSTRQEKNRSPFSPGYLIKNYKKWENKQWYHQRFDGTPYLMHVIGEAETFTDENMKEETYFTSHFCFYEEGKADWFIWMDDIDRVTQTVLDHGKRSANWHHKFIKKWDSRIKDFLLFGDRIAGTDLQSLFDNDLIDLHDKYIDTVIRRFSSSSAIDGFALGSDTLLSDRLREYYEKSDFKNTLKFADFFTKLTSPIYLSFINKAEIELIKLAQKIEKSPHEKRRLLREYQSRFFWLKNNYVDAHILSLDYIESEVSRVVSSGHDLEHSIKNLEEVVGAHKQEKKEMLSKLNLDKETIFLITVTEEFTRWQDERKRDTLFTTHYASLLLNEIGRRVKLDPEDMKYMSPREVSRIFIEKPAQKILQQRRENCVFYWDKKAHDVISGKQAKDVYKAIFPEVAVEDIDDFRGLTASVGEAQGKVKVVTTVKDINKVNKGDVLVAVMTRPDYVPAMKKASAIVTDEGGITSHAAIISRELKIPCVIGTKIATTVLKDGDEVQVKATHATVKILKRSK